MALFFSFLFSVQLLSQLSGQASWALSPSLSETTPSASGLASESLLTTPNYSRPACRLSIEETILPDFSCNSGEANCYLQAVAILRAQQAQLQSKLVGCPVMPDASYLNEYDLTNQKSEYAFVYLPGLFTTAAQFSNFKNTIGDNNAVFMTLPGHGATAADGWRLTPEHWKLAVERSLNLASYLGRKLIVVGQSTGGYLVLWAAAQNKFPIAGLAVLEPAVKVRNYYGAALCYIPNFDLNHVTGGDYFERDVNLGCVIRSLSEQFTPQLEKPETLALLAHIPTYVFINPNDLVVSSQASLNFATKLAQAGGKVWLESYLNDFEGKQYHGRVTYLPLRPRFAERLAPGSDFQQVIRGRNSYAEFLAENFNLCDFVENSQFLHSFNKNYTSLYPISFLGFSRVDQLLAELRSVQALQALSSKSKETISLYKDLFEQVWKFRSGLSFPVDNSKALVMQDKKWKEFQGLCCHLFEKTQRVYTTSFVGPQIQDLNAQASAYDFYLSQAKQQEIDPVMAQKLIDLISGQGEDQLVKLVKADFAQARSAESLIGRLGESLTGRLCPSFAPIASMKPSVQTLQSQITEFDLTH
jgi:acetyl esterase/lipase